MKLGRKLVALVTVFLMVFGGMPMTTAFAISYDFDYDGLGNGEDICTSRSWDGGLFGLFPHWDYHYATAAIIKLDDESDHDKEYKTFCLNMNKNVSVSMNYGRNDSYDVPSASNIRGILAANAASSGIANLDNDEIAAAKQAAIWHFTDGFNLPDYENKAEVYSLYQWLLSQTRGEDGTAAITVSFNRLLEYKNNFSKADLEFKYKVTGGTVTGLTCAAVAGVTFEFVDPASDGDSEWNYIKAKNVPVNSDFTLTVTGNQEKQVFYKYVSTGGSRFQSLAGLPVAVSSPVSASAVACFGSITITKNVGAETIRTGDSFTFKLYQGASASGTPFRTKTINSATSFTFGGLPYGQYTLTEENSGSFNGTPVFTGDISDQHVTVGSTVQNVTVTNSKLKGSIHVTKNLSGETMRAGDKFTFNLYAGTAATGTPVKTHDINPGDALSFDFTGLEYGQYYIDEVKVGSFNGMPGYSPRVITVSGTEQNVTVTNSRLKGSIHVTKNLSDETMRAGDKFTFNLYAGTSASGTLVRTHDINPGDALSFNFDDLEYGQYYIDEVKVGSFNGIPDYSSRVITVGGTVQNVTVKNSRLKGSIHVTKNLNGGTMRAGDKFTFNLYAGTSVTGTLVRTHDINPGDALSFNFDDLEYGQYYIDEVKVGSFNGTPGYSPRVITVSGTPQDVTVTNSRLLNKIQITKNLGSETMRAGDKFTFNLYTGTSASGTLVRTHDINPGDALSFNFEDLEYGQYYLEEVKTGSFNGTPEYDGDIAGQVITVGATVQEVTVKNSRLYNKIHITKSVGDEIVRTGDKFTFNLYAGPSKTGDPIRSQDLTAAGEFEFTGLEYGQYFLEEVIVGSFNGAPDFGGDIAGQVVTVGADVQNVTVTNTKLKGKITVTKALAGGITDTTARFVFTLTPMFGGMALRSPSLIAGGSYTFENLEFGEYRIAEESSYGFAANPSFTGDIKLLTADIVVVDSTGTEAVTCTNTKLFGSVKVNKTVNLEEGDTAAIPDFKVEIVGPTGNPNAASKTQTYTIHNGDNTISNLEYGNYTIRELTDATNMPQGYSFVSIDSGTFSVDGSAADEIAVVNEKLYGAIEVTKTLKDGATPLDGTKFQFKLMEGDRQVGATQTLVWSTTGVNKVTFAKPDYLLEIGHTYKVVELNNAFGYTIDPAFSTGYEVTIRSTVTAAISCTNEKLLGKIVVSKSVVGGTPKAGQEFVFTLMKGTATVATKTIKWPATTCEFTGLEYGDYKVQESSAFGFTTDSDKSVKVESSSQNVAFSNTMLFGDVTVTKTVTDGPAHDDDVFTFELRQGETVIDTQTIKAPATTCVFKHVPYGDYKIIEKFIEGYDLDDGFESGLPIRVDGATESATCTNTRLYGSIEVTKSFTADTVKAPDGTEFKFRLIDMETNEPMGADQVVTWSSTDDNKVTFAKPDYVLQYGHSYKVVELPVTGYTIDPAFADGYEVTITGEVPNPALTCTNTRLGTITVSKQMTGDYVGTPVFDFTISGPSFEGAEAFTLTPDKSKLFDGLANGEYVITETVPDGYMLSAIGGSGTVGTGDASNSYTITVSNGSVETVDGTATFTNGQLGKLQVVKKDSEAPAVYLGGAVFKVTKSDNPKVTFNLTTSGAADETLGTATSGWLVPGDYLVQEITAPDGYAIDDAAAKTLTVTAGGTAKITFTDSMGSLLILKRSSFGTNPALGGVIFQLLKSKPANDGSVNEKDIVGTASTGTDGIARFDRLNIGATYYVREIKQAPGYDIDTALVKAVTPKVNPQLADAVGFIDNPMGTVRVTKTDSADATKKLAGAVFGIYTDAECTAANLVFTMAETNANGVAVSSPLRFGGGTSATYYVKEITAPAGYVLNTSAQSVTFSEAGQEVSLTFADTRNVGSISIFKKDSLTKAALAGATFTLYSDAAATVQVGSPVTTGADGYAKFTDLAPGTYYIVETAAPTNYLLPEPKAIFDAAVTAGGVVSLDIENQYNPPKDIQTGMMDWNVLLIGGLALLAGLLLVVFSRKRRMSHTR